MDRDQDGDLEQAVHGAYPFAGMRVPGKKGRVYDRSTINPL